MRDSLSLHLALYRRQKALIARALDGRTPAFARYEARYRRRTRAYRRTLSLEEALSQALAADVVHVGDYHTLPLAQQTYLTLVERARRSPRRVVMALECVEGRHQPLVDAYLSGKLPEQRFWARLARECADALALWPAFRELLVYARKHRVQVLGLDVRAQGPRSLETRDRFAAERLAEAARADDRPLVLALVGQYHVAPCHLPAAVVRALGRDSGLTQQVVYQNCEGVWWALAREGQAGRAEAVELGDGALCLVNTSPVVCQQSFLDYLELAGGDSPALEMSAPERFRDLARRIARGMGVRVDGALDALEVVSVADVDFERRLRARGRFSAREAAALRRHVLSRESAYIPRARMAYLASLSLHHAAEEAAHFVRHCAVGDAMDAPRSGADAFYARCWEEALAYFGAKLVNPHRRCEDVREWARVFHEERGEKRDVAAFVLAHKAAELQPGADVTALLPLQRPRLFDAVSHALGYLLGEALYGAFDVGEVGRAELRALFRDPLTAPGALYLAWVQRLAVPADVSRTA